MPKFLNDVDFNKNQLQNTVIHPSATAPSNPKQGQIYFNTTDNNIYRYDGTQWVTYQNELDTAATGTISIDSAPVAASSNLITSGGVYSAIQNIPSPPVTSVNTQTGAVVLDANNINYDSTYTVKGKIDTIVASGGEPNVIEIVEVNGTALTITDKTVDVPVPTSAASSTAGISIADHSTADIYTVGGTASITGVSGSTFVIGVQSTTTTASKVTLGTAISVPNVTAAGSGSFTQGSFSGGSFEQGTDSFTPNTPTAIDTTKFSGGSFTQGTDSFTAATHGSDSFTAAKLNTGFYTAGTAASFTRGTFSGGSFTQGTDSFTANTPTAIDTSKFSGGSFAQGTFRGGSGSLTLSVTNHVLSFSHVHDPATHANDSFTSASLASGFYSAGTAASFTQGTDNFTAATHANDSFTANTPTAIDVTKFSGGSFTQGSFNGGSFTQGTDNHTAASLGTGFYTAGTAASFTQGEDEFTPATHGADSHTHTPPTIGTAISVPNVTDVDDVTVPIKNTSSTTVPTAAASATTVATRSANTTTVVTGKTHTITDNGHTHILSVS